MKQMPNTIKVAMIGAVALIISTIIAGLFGLYCNKTQDKKSINTSISTCDSSKVSILNNQNDIKGDFVGGDKIVVNNKLSQTNKSSKIDAPNALIVTQNQNGDNNLNVTQISDSYATRNDSIMIKEINYPSSGEYGINILNKSTIRYSSGTYSMNAMIPKNQNLTVEISSAMKNCGIPVFQSIPSWKTFDLKTKGDTISRKFKTVKFGIVDLEIYLYEGEINLAIYENDSETVTWRKTLIVEN